jgi:hypothetical protein
MKFLETACNLNTDTTTNTILYLDLEDRENNEIKLSTQSEHITLQNFRIAAKFNTSVVQDLKQFHSVDGEAMVMNALESESLANKQKKLSELYHNLADMSDNEILSGWKKTIRGIFPKITFQDYIPITSRSASENLVRNIMVRSYMITSRSLKGSADFILCGRSTASLIQGHSSFVVDTNNISLSNPQEITSIGTLNGRIMVFVDNNMKFSDNTIIVGRYTKNNEAGVYIVENRGARSIIENSPSLDHPSDKKIYLVEKLSFHATKNAHLNFVKYEVSFTKRPLWKRILGI